MKILGGLAGLERQGKKKWRHQVIEAVQQFKSAVPADSVVLAGGNARLLKKLPSGTRLENNSNAFQADIAFGPSFTAA
ncbi:MAG: hypothetical protein WBN92_15160 [Terriglobia bacterium]